LSQRFSRNPLSLAAAVTEKVDGDLRAPSDRARSKNAPGGRVPPRTNCMLWLSQSVHLDSTPVTPVVPICILQEHAEITEAKIISAPSAASCKSIGALLRQDGRLKCAPPSLRLAHGLRSHRPAQAAIRPALPVRQRHALRCLLRPRPRR